MFNTLFYIDESSPSGLKWKCNRGNQKFKDKPAGTLNNRGYWVVEVNHKSLVVHRIIAILNNLLDDYYCDLEVDHINRDRSDNRLSNLRVVTRRINLTNKGIYKNNKSGVAGVYWCKGRPKLSVIISYNGKKYHLGYFDTLLDAVSARLGKLNELKRI
ncbi:hypothetical protein RCIP0089_00033 [Klebsiella phage RCIP0089]|jgi:hypothetical protein